jgi:hypothetical protein
MVGRNASEGIEPRKRYYCRWAKGFKFWKPAASQAIKASMRRRAGVEVHGRLFNGLRRNLGEPSRSQKESFQQAEKARRKPAARQSDQLIVEE